MTTFIEDRIDFDNGFTSILGMRYDTYELEATVADDAFSELTVTLVVEYEMAFADNAKDGYTLHNISVSWMPDAKLEGFMLTLRIDNPFDQFSASYSFLAGASFDPLFQDHPLIQKWYWLDCNSYQL